MKSIVLDLDLSASTHTQSGDDYKYVFTLPLLPAFAVEYFTLHYGPMMLFNGPNYTISGNQLTITFQFELDQEDGSTLVLHYHGIRDYALLFPAVTPDSLQERLGEYYREAEQAFDSASWLSFMLMCGAIFEGILHHKLGANDTFATLIANAASANHIDSNTQSVMNTVRDYRNLIHANRHTSPYVTRADAMDARTTLDKLIRQS